MASQWPPRSPHEALLGTPGGRARLQRLADRTSPSPSPAKLRTARSSSALQTRVRSAAVSEGLDDTLDDDDDDDEESLQLKLQAIQARLKLKRLQATKALKQKAVGTGEDARDSRPVMATTRPGLAPIDIREHREVPLQSGLAAARDRAERLLSQNAVQVPASPVKKGTAPSVVDLQTSPRRILLGIDKGKRAADMSLKRAPSTRKGSEFGAADLQGSYLRTSKTSVSHHEQTADAPRPMSFNERLAAARSNENSRQERQHKIEKMRSKAFDVGRREMEEYKENAIDIPHAPAKEQEFTRDEILASMGNQKPGHLHRSNTAPSIRSGSQELSESEPRGFEPFSGYHLKRRILPHQVITRALSGRKSYNIHELLRQVRAPNWSLPDVESDVVVFGIVAGKSEPRSHKAGPGGGGKPGQDRGKYMVLTLVDLTYEVELFLFNSGFDRFWKLTPGTVLAVLNPSIMPPPPARQAAGRFSLVINSDADTILELGIARDLGYCKTVKKDGNLCNGWINARRTEFCEFHTNDALSKTRSARIELTDGHGAGGVKRKPMRELLLQKEKAQQERRKYAGVFVSGEGGMSAVRLLDDDEREGGLADRKEREAALRRRLAAQEKERKIAKKLSEMGGGAGKEYMGRSATSAAIGPGSSVSSSSTAAASLFSGQKASTSAGGSSSSHVSSNMQAPRPDARTLGLVLPKGERPKIDLGPVKRKRVESSQNTGTGGKKDGVKPIFGWGATLKDKLSRMKEGERLDGRHSAAFTEGSIEQALGKAATTAAANDGCTPGNHGDPSPVRKKTRFVTEKGIREAGRESLGEPLSAMAKIRKQVLLGLDDGNNDDDDDDDDDDLVIVQ